MQTRFHNYRAPLQSFAENLRIAGLVHPGVYSGFDSMTLVSGNTLRFSHTKGLQHTTIAGAAADKRSVVLSNQGTVVMEDSPIDLTVDFNVGNSKMRIDLLVMSHSYINSVGGATATYSIIKGALESTEEPPLSNPGLQVKIGRIRVGAGDATHNWTSWERIEAKHPGGKMAFTKEDENNILSLTSFAHFQNFDIYRIPGFYYLSGNPTMGPTGGGEFFLIVLGRNSNIAQMALSRDTGKTYTRSYNATTTSWGPWVNLNNPDITVSIADLANAIGNLEYAYNNYVTDGDSLTVAIGKLDHALQLLSVLVSNHTTAIDNNSTAITSKANKSLVLTAGDGLIGGGDLGSDRTFHVNVDGSTLEISSDAVRVKANGITATQLADGAVYAEIGWNPQEISIPAWNMDTTAILAVPHGLSLASVKKIKMMSAFIRNDADTYRQPVPCSNGVSDQPDVFFYMLGTAPNQHCIDDTNIYLARRDSGAFDNSNYSSTSFNRGTIALWIGN